MSDKIDDILQERGKNYGDFGDIAIIQEAIVSGMNWDGKLKRANIEQRHALEMIALKMARIVCGDPNYTDNWDDIAGYAKLISQRITSSKQ